MERRGTQPRRVGRTALVSFTGRRFYVGTSGPDEAYRSRHAATQPRNYGGNMGTVGASSETSTQTPGVGIVDMKLEVVVVPVSDVDRAKLFYQALGRRRPVGR